MNKEVINYNDYGKQNLENLRENVTVRLTDAFSKDIISMDEFEKRIKLANLADRPSLLEDLTIDLPAVAQNSNVSYQEEKKSSLFQGTNREIIGAPAVSTTSILSDRRLNGNWLSSDKANCFTVLGSTRLDLRDTELPPGATKIDLFTVLGDVRIFVPKDCPVRLNVFSLLADQKIDKQVNQQTKNAHSWVEISGMGVLSDVRVSI